MKQFDISSSSTILTLFTLLPLGISTAVAAATAAPNTDLSLPKDLKSVVGSIPGWNLIGDAVLDAGRISLTKLGEKNQIGALWSTNSNGLDTWTLDVDFEAGGKVMPDGGLGLWYVTQQLGAGSAHGSQETWDGLGLLVDSALSDPSKGDSDDNSVGAVQVFLNDGSKSFNEISKNPEANAVSLCRVDYRNTGSLTKIKMSYAPGLFRVLVNGQLCVQTDKITLPKNGYFGASSGGPGVSDTFVIHRFETFSGVHPSVEEIDAMVTQKDVPAKPDTPTQNNQNQNQNPPAGQIQARQVTDQQASQPVAGQTSNQQKDIDTILNHFNTYADKTQQQIEAQNSNMKTLIASLNVDITAQLAQHIEAQEKQQAEQLAQTQQKLERKINSLESVVKELIQLLQASTSTQQQQHQQAEKNKPAMAAELKTLHNRLDDISSALKQHGSSLDSLPGSFNDAIAKGTHPIWLLITVPLVFVGVAFVLYKVFGSNRYNYHAKLP